MQPADRSYAAVGVTFATALVVLVVAYLAFAGHGAWFPETKPLRFDARSLVAISGTATQDRGALIVAANPPSDTLIVSAVATLQAADYPGIAWDVAGLPAGTQARLAWREGSISPRAFTRTIPVMANGTLAPLVMGDDPNWSGRVTGLALVLKLPAPVSVRIDGVTAQTLSVATVLGQRVREWLAFERWTGSSINSVVIGADVLELPLPALLGLAAVLATVVVLALARWRPAAAGSTVPAALAAMFMVATFLLDAQWQSVLFRQLKATAAQFAGRDDAAKHLAAEDGPLFAFIEAARARMPATPVRVFMLADAPYFRGRGAYHLYPHNVYFDPFGNRTFAPAALRPGDYLIAYHRTGITYDAAGQRLSWDAGSPIAAQRLLDDANGALYRIR